MKGWEWRVFFPGAKEADGPFPINTQVEKRCDLYLDLNASHLGLKVRNYPSKPRLELKVELEMKETADGQVFHYWKKYQLGTFSPADCGSIEKPRVDMNTITSLLKTGIKGAKPSGKKHKYYEEALMRIKESEGVPLCAMDKRRRQQMHNDGAKFEHTAYKIYTTDDQATVHAARGVTWAIEGRPREVKAALADRAPIPEPLKKIVVEAHYPEFVMGIVSNM